MPISDILKPKYLLIAICILFLITRLYKITSIPASVYWDEASIGYNAYSIAQTGKDEWGELLPIHFRAFGEFKLPVYIYAVSVFVKTFGLSEFSIRLPSVLFSLGVVIITYFLVKKLTENALLGLLSSFIVSISPWFFIFSRTGYEASAGLMFYLLAIYLFLSIKKNSWLLLFSVLSFILSAYSYNSFRIISPLTILIFLSVREIMPNVTKIKIPLIISVIFLIISAIPIYRLYKYDAGGARFQAVNEKNSVATIKNYLSHFTFDFLLFGDKNLRSQQANFGQIHFPEFLLIPLGLIYICRKSKYANLLVPLLLIGPIPAALTKESPHALRAISLVPFLCIFSAGGILQLKELLKLKYLEVGVVIILSLFFINYFFSFINTYPTQSSSAWQYGYKQIYHQFEDELANNSVFITDEYAQPYIFALFYQKYNPEVFREEVVRNSIDQWGFSTVARFGKFEFGKFNNLNINSQNILVFNDKKIPEENLLYSIKFLDGNTALWVYQFKK